MKLRFTRRSLSDLQRLRAFIARENPPAAQRVIDALKHSIRHLQDHPAMGIVIDSGSGFRQWVAGDYIVRYLPDEQTVHIMRIWHGKERRSDSER